MYLSSVLMPRKAFRSLIETVAILSLVISQNSRPDNRVIPSGTASRSLQCSASDCNFLRCKIASGNETIVLLSMITSFIRTSLVISCGEITQKAFSLGTLSIHVDGEKKLLETKNTERFALFVRSHSISINKKRI
jgi:hypothetical protein